PVQLPGAMRGRRRLRIEGLHGRQVPTSGVRADLREHGPLRPERRLRVDAVHEGCVQVATRLGSGSRMMGWRLRSEAKRPSLALWAAALVGCSVPQVEYYDAAVGRHDASAAPDADGSTKADAPAADAPVPLYCAPENPSPPDGGTCCSMEGGVCFGSCDQKV